MGFHWDVYAKVNGLVFAFGLLTYALAQHSGSVFDTYDSSSHGYNYWRALLTQCAWAYLGATLRNGLLVVTLTLLTRHQTPLRAVDPNAPEEEDAVVTNAASVSSDIICSC